MNNRAIGKPTAITNIAELKSIGLIFGDYGSGKTYLSGTIHDVIKDMELNPLKLPDGWITSNRLLLLNAELGSDGLSPKHESEVINKTIKNYNDFCKMYDFLKLHIKFYKENNVDMLLKLQHKYFGQKATDMKELFIFRAVVIDSLTEIQKFCIYDIRGIDETTTLDDEFGSMRIQDWGDALEKILITIRSFRKLPIVTLFLCQQNEVYDDNNKLTDIDLDLQGKAYRKVQGFFDYVGFYKKVVAKDGVTTRTLYFEPVGPFKVKNRFAGYDGKPMANPVASDFLKYKINRQQSENIGKLTF